MRFSFALAACAVAVTLEVLIDRLTGQRLYPFLTSLAAIIVSASWAGAVPGLATTTLLAGWSVFDLSHQGISPASTLVQCSVFLAAGVLLSLGSSRLRRSMKEVATSENWHRQLLESAAEGIWVHDEQGVITYANARMADMLGLAVASLTGRKVEEFFFPEDQSVERVRAANLRNGRKDQFDRRLRRPDGSELWVLTGSNPISVETLLGDAPGTLAMMTDITERKRAEYALRRSEERFRNLFENVLEGVYQSTPDGRILAANPMILRMFGIAKEEMNDLNIASDFYIDPNLRSRLLEQMERDGGYQNVEYELKRRDGQIITVLENARVVRDENGAVLYYEGTMTDVTPRKRMEEQLRQAQKVEALGRLAGSVAADFNNALTVITGYTQLAMGNLPPSHPARPSTEQVLEAAEHAMALTKQLLLFSRRQAPPGEAADLNQIIARSEAARQTGLALSLSGEPLHVHATAEQIERVLRDLPASLRAKFPSAALQLKTEQTDLEQDSSARCANAAPGSYAVLSIGDMSGSPEMSALLADPFFVAIQAGESAAMGLSETHAIVAQCEGFIASAAQPVSHARFHVFLPVAAPPGGESVPQSEPIPARETILLVEDKPLVRELSRDMLERQGYRVILASNAREAEQMSRGAVSFDLLITDAEMPDSTGAELASRLREAHPRLKVLYLSGYADDAQDGWKAAENGVFLRKPFSAESLGQKIRQVLG